MSNTEECTCGAAHIKYTPGGSLSCGKCEKPLPKNRTYTYYTVRVTDYTDRFLREVARLEHKAAEDIIELAIVQHIFFVDYSTQQLKERVEQLEKELEKYRPRDQVSLTCSSF